MLGPSNLQELYDLTIKAFDLAWRYHLPVIILGDGYLSKMTGVVNTQRPGKVTAAKPIIQNGERVMNMRNCYSQEAELAQVLHRELKEFAAISAVVAEAETVKTTDARVVVFAWGTVGSAAREAVKKLRAEGKPVGLFRPITLRPFAATRAKIAASGAKKILIAESSFGQFGRLVTESLFGLAGVSIDRLYRPAEGITSEDIEEKLRSML